MTQPAQLSFSHEFQLTESEFVGLWGIVSRRTRLPRYLATVALGIAMLFSPYTLLIGIIVLVLALLLPLANLTVRATAMATFRKSKYLHCPVKYTLSEDGVEAQGLSFKAWSAWANLYVWRIAGPWLILSAHASPSFYFRVADLQGAGIWERVYSLVRAHAVEYNSPKTHPILIGPVRSQQ
jgi:hypothetical protein